MTPRAIEQVLLEYATKFAANLPLAEVRRLPWLATDEQRVSIALEDPNWYCHPYPGKEHIITFTCYGPDARGTDHRWSVDTKLQKVTPI